MVGRIPQAFIDDLIGRIDIVEVIDQRVPLKKAGRELKACCPFHEEKTPSFTVSPAKQFYHCFGCGAHGTALGFLMDYARLDFVEAVEELARRAGVEVPREGGGNGSTDATETAPLYDMLERVNAFYRRQLREHAQAPRAVEYLKARGVSGEIARDFAVGFAPPGWDNALRALGAEEESVKALRLAGVVTERESGGDYDRLRDRIVFPIRDRRGRTVGFGGRVLGDDTPKYLNSPETPIFHKGRELYGLYEARRQRGSLERLIVVEGYMDVVALAQSGIRNAVATLGTAATPEQIEQMFKAAGDIVFCFDGDEAGRRAAWRALENALPCLHAGRQAFFMFLPDGEDPDSMVRAQGQAAFEAAAAEAVSLGTFLFDHLSEDVDLTTIDGRTRLVELARPLIERMPAGTFRALAAQRLAELTGIDERATASIAGRPANPGANRVQVGPGAGPSPVRGGKPSGAAGGPGRRLARSAIELLLHHPELGTRPAPEGSSWSRDDLQALGLPGAELLADMLETLRDRPNLTTAGLVEHFRDHPLGSHLASLAGRPALLEHGHEQEFDDCVRRLGRMARELTIKSRIAELDEKLSSQARLGSEADASWSAEEKTERRQLDRELVELATMDGTSEPKS